MNPDAVEELVSAGMPAGMLTNAPNGQPGLATRLNHQMLQLLRAGKRGSNYRAKSIQKGPLLRELNLSATHLLRSASGLLSELFSSECGFACDMETQDGGSCRWSTKIDEIPTCIDQFNSLRLIKELSKLPPKQQELIVQILTVEQELKLLRVHLDFANEDGWTHAELERKQEIARAISVKNKLRQALSREGRLWLPNKKKLIDALGLTAILTPAALRENATSDELLRGALWYQSLGKSMYMPLPLDDANSPIVLEQWRIHWNDYEECAKGILLIAHWVRALGSVDIYHRCKLCYRHRGPAMKCHCIVHKRTGKLRITRREQLVAREYRRALGAPTPAVNCGGKSIDEITNEPPAIGVIESVKRLGLPVEIVSPICQLATLLRWLHPLLCAQQRELIALQFNRMLNDCLRPFAVTTFATDLAYRENQILRRSAALRLGWDRFFKSVFGSVAGPDIALGAGRGMPIDLDHPLASTQSLISTQKLVCDLHCFRMWIEADLAIDKLAYLDDATILNEFHRQQERLGRKPSLRELGRELKSSPETIRLSLTRSASSHGTGSPRRRHSKIRGAVKP